MSGTIPVALTLNYDGVALLQSGTTTNTVSGTAPGQTLDGKKGVNNAIYSDGGGSTLVGGGASDTFYVEASDDDVIVAAGSGIDTIVSWAAYYALPANVQDLILQAASGGMGVGNSLNNLLVAEGPSNYTLVAGTGNDVMIGNASGSSLDTGAGSTMFIIAEGDGNDVISNFVPGVDMIRLENYTNLTSFAELQAAMSQVGSDVVINLSSSESLTLRNVTIGALSASNFYLPDYLPNMKLMFNSNFNNFVTSPNGSVGWDTTGGAGWRTLPSNNEAEYYSDSSVGVNPFSVSNGILTITASPGTNPLGLPYNSGIITTEGMFSAEYGYFAVTAKLPAGAGLWPAIWLLPENLSWPPELDILEGLQQNTDEIHTGAIWGTSTNELTLGSWNYSGDTSNSFNTYAVDWEPNTITWYFDGNEVFSEATPSDMNQAMYLLINLAVGGAGSWPGEPTSASEFPATMEISSVQFYASANTVDVNGSAVISGSPAVNIVGTTATSATTTPTVTSVTMSPASGDFTVGTVITITVAFGEAMTVTGGTPTLALNDGGVATYQSGSGSSSLVFVYTVAASQNTSDLTLATTNAIGLNGATITDGSGNAAVLSGANGYNPAGTLQIDTSRPSIKSVTTSPVSGEFTTGAVITFTVTFGQVVYLTGGTPTLALNDGGAATYVSGSGSSALVFSYTVAAGQNITALEPSTSSAIALNGATLSDAAGNQARIDVATGYVLAGTLQIDTTPPTVTSVAYSLQSGNLGAGKVINLTVNFSEVVTVVGGTPSIALNDGGTATYVSGSGTGTLVFSYTVASGQNTSALAIAASSALSLNGATIEDAAGNQAVVTAINGVAPTGTVQIDTAAPKVSSVAFSQQSGELGIGATVTITVKFSGKVLLSGGTPTIALNDGGTASYVSGSGTGSLVFTYTVAAGDNVSVLALAATNAISLNGASLVDAAGNQAVLTAANGAAPTGTLQIDTTQPTITAVVSSVTSGALVTGNVVLITLDFSATVVVSGGTPTITLNDGGQATYVSGSGTNALVFSYTVNTYQNAPTMKLIASGAVSLNGATIEDAAGNVAVLSSADGYILPGTVRVNTTPTSVVLTSSESYSVGNGTYAITGTASNTTASFGNGNQTMNVTGVNDTFTFGSGEDTVLVTGTGDNVTLGAGTSTVTIVGNYGTISIGATAIDATVINADGYDDIVKSVRTGNVNVSDVVGNATVALGNGNDNIVLAGIYNTVTVGAGNSIISAGVGTVNASGHNNITTGAGNSTITVTGWNNVLDAGAGINFLNGGSGIDVFVLNGIGQGFDTITGFTVSNGDVLDIGNAIAGASTQVTLADITSYITATTSGGNTTLYADLTPGSGTPYAFAMLDNVSATVSQLVSAHALALS